VSDLVLISARQPSVDSGGTVVPVWTISGQVTSSDLVILIHGFNDNKAFAVGAYGALLANLKQKFPSQTAQFIEFFWPGDEPNPVTSALSYSSKIQPAKDSAAGLSTYFTALSQSRAISISLVGHSLGCRIILELLTRWAAAPPAGIQVRAIVLMAAAVVENSVNAGQSLRPGADLTSRNPVLYSKGDDVLRLTFPPGETMAHEGFFPTAVGRFGGPVGAWHIPQPMSDNGKDYGHSDYWSGNSSSTAVAVALGGAPASATPENTVATVTLPSPNEIAENSIPARVMSSRPTFG
jgi:pimeloyl-ACP methyl ester carboxylesterase